MMWCRENGNFDPNVSVLASDIRFVDIDVPLTGLSLSRTMVSLGTGDKAYLTAFPIPANAPLPALTWESDNETVARVSQGGRVTALHAGSTTITVSGGGCSVTCTVTVTARAANEYRIGALIVRDADGTALSTVPHGDFWVTIPVTKLCEGGDTLILLAAYSASGQYKGLMYVEVSDLPAGATVKVTLPLKNTDGGIAQLKVFPIASFENLIPLGTAASFPSQ